MLSLKRSVLLLWVLCYAPQTLAFTDGSGYQILIAVQESVQQLQKQYRELKNSRETLQQLNELTQQNASTITPRGSIG